MKNNRSRFIYSKLSIAEMVPFLDGKLIYLDSDIIVKDDIQELWNVDITNYVLAAACEKEFNRYDEMNFPKDAAHFNSGVMVINLKKWRSTRIFEKAYDFLIKNLNNKSYTTGFYDQPALNAALYKQPWLPLSPRWNQWTGLFDLVKPDLYYEIREYEEALNNPAIIHYTGRNKPWDFLCDRPQSEEYNNYLKKSLWRDYIPKEKELLENRKLILFGTGKESERITRKLSQKGIQASYYVDNNSKLWDTEFQQRRVYSPDILQLENKSGLFILIVSMFYEEIKNQLEQLGFEENTHFMHSMVL